MKKIVGGEWRAKRLARFLASSRNRDSRVAVGMRSRHLALE
jgi:hypothetical protein